MKTILPVKWEKTELPIPKRVDEEEAQKLVASGQYVFCPKQYYKQIVLGKPCGITAEQVLELIAQRKIK